MEYIEINLQTRLKYKEKGRVHKLITQSGILFISETKNLPNNNLKQGYKGLTKEIDQFSFPRNRFSQRESIPYHHNASI